MVALNYRVRPESRRIWFSGDWVNHIAATTFRGVTLSPTTDITNSLTTQLVAVNGRVGFTLTTTDNVGLISLVFLDTPLYVARWLTRGAKRTVSPGQVPRDVIKGPCGNPGTTRSLELIRSSKHLFPAFLVLG